MVDTLKSRQDKRSRDTGAAPLPGDRELFPLPEDFDLDAPIPLVPAESHLTAADAMSASAVAERLDTLAREFDMLASRLRRQAGVIRYTGRVTGLR